MKTLPQFVILSIIGAMLAGCATITEWERLKGVNAYLDENPQVTADTASALRSKTLMKGMTKKEVALCIGQPSKAEYTQDGDTNICVWTYSEIPGNDSRLPEAVIVAALFVQESDGSKLASWLTKKDAMEPEPQSAAPAISKDGPAPAPRISSKKELPAASSTPSGKQVPDSWPTLKLDGIMKRGNESSVMLNGKLVGIGETIEGVTVVSVSENGALLDLSGEKFFLIKERTR